MRTKLLLAFLIVLVAFNCCAQNKSKVDSAWSSVKQDFQRRADLIINLIGPLSKSSKIQGEDLDSLRKMNTAFSQYLDSSLTLTPRYISRTATLCLALQSTLQRVFAKAGNDKKLNKDDLFINLQLHLEGIENRIRVAIIDYNQVCRANNKIHLQFPNLDRGGIEIRFDQ